MKTHRAPGQASRVMAGFSMVELLVAMLITIIISGAIYGLIAGGASAARREPAVADRQQNLRISMDLLTRDIQNAGNGVPAYLQLFAASLPGGVSMNGAGPQGPNGPTDRIQIRGNDGSCPSMTICDPGGGSSVATGTVLPPCFHLPGPILVWTYPGNSSCSGCSAVMWGCEPGPGTTNACSGAGTNGHVVFPHGQAPEYNPSGGPPFDADGMTSVGLYEWKVLIDAEGVPNLWRTSFDPASVTVSGRCAADNAGSGFGWVMVARGIEDLQFQYMMQGNVGSGLEPPVDPNDDTTTGWRNVSVDQALVPGTVIGTGAVNNSFDPMLTVRQVRITLGARTIGVGSLQGETTSPNTSMTSGRTALRESMTTVVSPRAALTMLSHASPNPLYQ
jgi:type IV pilus assembly protein PilW